MSAAKTPSRERERGRDDRKPSFTTTAARLAGLAGAIAGWRPDEFWRATPAELEAVLAAFAGPAAAPPPNAAIRAALQEQYPDG